MKVPRILCDYARIFQPAGTRGCGTGEDKWALQKELPSTGKKEANRQQVVAVGMSPQRLMRPGEGQGFRGQSKALPSHRGGGKWS